MKDSPTAPAGTAHISPCGRYRYTLTRPALPGPVTYAEPIPFIMLNPSTADADTDDATIRRCRAFAAEWGYNGIVVANLFAFRATDPRDMLNCSDPVGPENDEAILRVLARCRRVICAWGNNAPWTRAYAVLDLIQQAGVTPLCLGVTGHGAPKHPLYLAKGTQARRYEWARAAA